MKSIFSMYTFIVVSLIVAFFTANGNLVNDARGETGVGKDVFKVVVSLIDITNSTKDITTIVNVKDQTKVKVFNAENPETEGQDTISYTMTFPDLAVDDGEPYTVCIVSSENFEIDCSEGNNSPLNRPEFVDISLSGGSTNEDQNQDGNEDND